MKRFHLFLAVAAAAVLTLSACSITIVGPPAADYTRDANDLPDTAVWSGSVAAGQRVLFELNVPTYVRTGYGVLYIELDRSLQLEVRTPYDYVFASSAGPSFFARGKQGLVSAAADELSAAAIGVPVTCRGSCVIVPTKQATTFYARVTNASGSTQNVNLYFYGDHEQDDGEPSNDNHATASLLDMASASGEQGAIEVLGDVDYWKVSATGTLSFSTAPGNPVGLAVEADYGKDGWKTIIETSGGTAEVFSGETIRVRSLMDRAGASAASRYTLLGN